MSDTVAEDDRLDLDALSRSVNGFEQVAIRQMFRERFETLAEDGVMFMRAILFIVAKRDGMADPDAYRNTMLLTVEDVVSRFNTSPAESEDAEAAAERDAQYAEFVVGVGLSFMPEQYLALTLGQRAALVEAANRHRR